MSSCVGSCVQRGGVMLKGNCKDFLKNFRFVSIIKVPFFSL